MGLLIQGHDKTGAEDAGLGAFVRARLYSLGSPGAEGDCLVSRRRHKHAALRGRGADPGGDHGRSWRLCSSLLRRRPRGRRCHPEQGAGEQSSVAVRRQRAGGRCGGHPGESLGLPSRQANGGMRGRRPGRRRRGRRRTRLGGDPGGSGAGGDWTAELRAAAATFILLALAARWAYLEGRAVRGDRMAERCAAGDRVRPGMQAEREGQACGARPCRGRRPREQSGRTCLAQRLLLRTASGAEDLTDFAAKLERLLGELPDDDEGTLPLRLRG